MLASCGDAESGSDPISEPDQLRWTELDNGDPLIFDFGTAASQLYEPAYRVTPLKFYTTTLGYGWLDEPTISATNRTTGNAVNRDFNSVLDATFRVDVPNGVYDVDIRTGDTAAHARSALVVEDILVGGDTILHPADEWPTHHQTVRVLDGNIDVWITDVTAGPTDPGDAIINGLWITRRDLPADPTAWELDTSGVEYRRATEAELIDNGWPLDTYLVHAPAGVFVPSLDLARVFVPIDDEEILEVEFDLVGSDPALEIVELGFGVASSGGSQSLVRYETAPTGAQGLLLEDTIRDGFMASVEIPMGTTSHQISNGEASWELATIPLANTVVPDGTVLYRSSAVGPGPSSFLAPFPTDSYDFALIGEIQWCMARENGWAAALGMRALWVHNGFAACFEGQCQNHHGVEMIQRALFCNVTEDQEAAADCDNGVDCPPNQFEHDYSYLGCNEQADCYANNIVANLQQAEDEGHFVPDLHIAQVVKHNTVQVPPIDPDEGPIHEYWQVCGAATFPDLADCDGTVPFTTDGVSVAADGFLCDTMSVSTHEFGHNFGAVHQSADVTFDGGYCEGTVMTGGTLKCNVFGTMESETLESCNLDDQTTLDYDDDTWCPAATQVDTDDCPRAAGQLLFD